MIKYAVDIRDIRPETVVNLVLEQAISGGFGPLSLGNMQLFLTWSTLAALQKYFRIVTRIRRYRVN